MPQHLKSQFEGSAQTGDFARVRPMVASSDAVMTPSPCSQLLNSQPSLVDGNSSGSAESMNSRVTSGGRIAGVSDDLPFYNPEKRPKTRTHRRAPLDGAQGIANVCCERLGQLLKCRWDVQVSQTILRGLIA